jgi:hypothetical protein
MHEVEESYRIFSIDYVYISMSFIYQIDIIWTYVSTGASMTTGKVLTCKVGQVVYMTITTDNTYVTPVDYTGNGMLTTTITGLPAHFLPQSSQYMDSSLLYNSTTTANQVSGQMKISPSNGDIIVTMNAGN